MKLVGSLKLTTMFISLYLRISKTLPRNKPLHLSKKKKKRMQNEKIKSENTAKINEFRLLFKAERDFLNGIDYFVF